MLLVTETDRQSENMLQKFAYFLERKMISFTYKHQNIFVCLEEKKKKQIVKKITISQLGILSERKKANKISSIK